MTPLAVVVIGVIAALVAYFLVHEVRSWRKLGDRVPTRRSWNDPAVGEARLQSQISPLGHPGDGGPGPS